MSEYQYYEFAAVDRPLTLEQQAELRTQSSRATITSHEFINAYHWSSLRGNPLDWMERYFDAHVHSTCWSSCTLMLKLPMVVLDSSLLQQFIEDGGSSSRLGYGEALAARQSAEQWIISWSFNDDSGDLDRFWQEDGPGWMERLLPLRDELLHGDTRPLYLGWLARVETGEISDDMPEPPLPAGLATPSLAQQALIEFLLIDPDLLQAAAADSPALSPQDPEGADFELWLDGQSDKQLRATVRRLLEGQGLQAQLAVRNAYLAWQRERQERPELPRRSLARIRDGITAIRSARLERERIARQAEVARREAEYAAMLDHLAQEAPQVWEEIDATVQHGTGKAYEQAFQLLQQLAEALRRAGRETEFRCDLVGLQQKHGRRPAWVKRLVQAGLC